MAFQICWARPARRWGPLLPRGHLQQQRPLHVPIWTRSTTCTRTRSCVPPPAARPLPHWDLPAAAAALAPLGIIHNIFPLAPILPYNLNNHHHTPPTLPLCICRHPPNPLPLVFPALALALALALVSVQSKEPCLLQHQPRQLRILLLLLPALALSTETAQPHRSLPTRRPPKLPVLPPRTPAPDNISHLANHFRIIFALWRPLMRLTRHKTLHQQLIQAQDRVLVPAIDQCSVSPLYQRPTTTLLLPYLT